MGGEEKQSRVNWAVASDGRRGYAEPLSPMSSYNYDDFPSHLDTPGEMSMLPAGMDGQSLSGASASSNGALQDWQQNALETLARVEPRRTKNRRGVAGAEFSANSTRAVTPETDGFELSSRHTSPRSLLSRDLDRRGGLVFGNGEEWSGAESVDSAPRNAPPVSFFMQSRPRTRTIGEPGRLRSTSNTLSMSRNRNRVGSTSSSLQEEPKSLPDSLRTSVVQGTSARSPSQLNSGSLKKNRTTTRKLVRKSRPSTPLQSGSDVPSVDSLPFPVTTSDAGRMVISMKSSCGRMRGQVDMQAGEGQFWQKGMCRIDDRNQGLIFEGGDDELLHVPVVPDLRGCRVKSVVMPQKYGKCLEITNHILGVVVRIIPGPPVDHDMWMAALLCFQQIRTGTMIASPDTTDAPSLPERPGPPHRGSSRNNLAGNIIKVAKLLLWDKGPPNSPATVLTRPSTRDPHSSMCSWRRVSCILQDNGVFKLLTENDVTLLSAIQLPQLSRCAIQRVDKSVLGEEYCIAIFPQYTERSTQLSIFRPVYIALESRVLMEVWFVLLRSFCVPELFGSQDLEPMQTNQGMFRIEKTLSMRIIEAKIRMPPKIGEKKASSGRMKREPDPSIGDYLAEIMLGGEVRARTVTKSDTKNPFWREEYEFLDLPQCLPRVSVVVKRIEQSLLGKEKVPSSGVNGSEEETEVVCGIINIFIDTFDKGNDTEKWYQIIDEEQQTIGELLIKIRYDELVVLLAKEYQPISELLHNFSDCLTQEIAQAMPSHLKMLTEILINIFQVSGYSVEWLKALVEDEIDGLGRDMPLTHRLRWSRRLGSNESFGSGSDREHTVRAIGRSLDNEANLLFRGNSLLTQSLDFHMRRLGKEYLEEVLLEKVVAINTLNPNCEIDPSRLGQGDDMDRNWTSLIALTTYVWDSIAESGNRCPAEIRQVLKYVRSCAEDRFGDYLRSAPYTSVSGFLFLRFFCPAILNPKLFGLLPDHPQPRAQRTFTLIAKSIQALANLSSFGHKEVWMEPMNRFLASHRHSLKEFLDVICSIPSERSTFALPASYSTPITILARLPPASREGFPSLPYLIDHAQNFAALVKLWLSSQTGGHPRKLEDPSELQRFHTLCVDLQRQTDACLTLAEHQSPDPLDLHWDDLVEDVEHTSLQDIDTLSRPEANLLRSPEWVESMVSLSSGHDDVTHGSSEADENTYFRTGKSTEGGSPLHSFAQHGTYNHTPPLPVTERPTTAVTTRSAGGTTYQQKGKEKKRHSLNFTKGARRS